MFLPHTHEEKNQDTFGGSGYVYYLECGDSNLSIYIYANSLDGFHYVSFFVCQLYGSKAGRKKKKRTAKEVHSRWRKLLVQRS